MNFFNFEQNSHEDNTLPLATGPISGHRKIAAILLGFFYGGSLVNGVEEGLEFVLNRNNPCHGVSVENRYIGSSWLRSLKKWFGQGAPVGAGAPRSNYSFTTPSACSPLGPSVTVNPTVSPSLSDLNPVA